MGTDTTVKKGPPGRRLSGRPSENNQTRKSDSSRAALRWVVGTVILTLFPTLATIIMAILREDSPLSWELILNNGELVLCSFLIVTSTLISCYNIKHQSILTDILLYFLVGIDFIQLIIYTVLKTNTTNNLITVAIVSVISLMISVSSSATWYYMTNRLGVK